MAAKPTVSERRPAINRRAARSRPSWSVPKRCPPDSGGAKRLRMSIWSWSKGMSQGPTMVASTRTRIATMPNIARRCRLKRSQGRWRAPFRGPRRAAPAASATVSVRRASLMSAGCADRRGRSRIGQEIAEEHEHRREHQDTHHHRIVAIAERIEEQTAHARPGEDRLGDQRAAEQGRQFEAGQRDHRQQRIAKRVPQEHHASAAIPWRARCGYSPA